MYEQVTPQALVSGAVGCLRATLAPQPYTSAVAPGFYRFYLRRADYERLQSVFPAIAEDANRALDQELWQLNRAAGSPRWFGQLFSGKKAHQAYLKPYTGWAFYFDVDDNLQEGQPYRIEASLEAIGSAPASDRQDVLPDVAGLQPGAAEVVPDASAVKENHVEIEAQASSLPAETEPTPDLFKTQPASSFVETQPASSLVETQAEPAADTLPTPPDEVLSVTLPADARVKPLTARRNEGGAGGGRVYAEISFTDERGPQVYLMKKAQIVVGRGGREYWVDLKLQTASDVSHEHLRIRYDEPAGRFQLKDLSTFGTTINGVEAASSMENQNGIKRDIDLWVELPAKARVGLAGVLFLDFKAIG